MDDFALFICGLVVTLIAGMGVLTSQVFLGYAKFKRKTMTENEKRVIELSK